MDKKRQNKYANVDKLSLIGILVKRFEISLSIGKRLSYLATKSVTYNIKEQNPILVNVRDSDYNDVCTSSELSRKSTAFKMSIN